MMFNSDTDLLFPPRAILALRDLRGDEWRCMIDTVLLCEERDIDRLAFVLMMANLGGCTTCQADSYRAMRGCTQCAIQTIRRFRGSDQDLLACFQEARKDIAVYLNKLEGSVE